MRSKFTMFLQTFCFTCPGDPVRAVHVGDGVHLLPGAHRSGAPPADPASHRLVPRHRTLLPGCGADLAGGVLHLPALPVFQHPDQRPLPEHQPSRQPVQVRPEPGPPGHRFHCGGRQTSLLKLRDPAPFPLRCISKHMNLFREQRFPVQTFA